MAWCEANDVHFLFGLARNERLIAEIATELDRAATRSRRTGRPKRCFKRFMWTTRGSWSRSRRVVAKAEWTAGEVTRASWSPRSRAGSARPSIFPASSVAGTCRLSQGHKVLLEFRRRHLAKPSSNHHALVTDPSGKGVPVLQPPSMTRFAPVIYELSSDAR